MQVDDAVISSIRKVRHQTSEEQGHDPQKVVAYYLELQKEYRERLLESPEGEGEMQTTEA
jgi:hypothetical protein